MRIGVFGDTHDQVANVERACQLLNAAHVDRVIHTGDITTVETLGLLSALTVPVAAVLGNNDWDREALLKHGTALGFQMASHELELTWFERNIFVVHDPEDLGENGIGVDHDDHDLILHGHTHRTRVEWVKRQSGKTDTLIVNSGECASAHEGRNRLAIVDLDALSTEIVGF